jgi:hypothetical protein
VEDVRPAYDERGDEAVQQERTSEVAAQVVAAAVFIGKFESSGYDTPSLL